MKKSFLIIIPLLALSSMLPARDFDVVSPSGHTLYCDMVQGGAMVVGLEYTASSDEPINLVIPQHVRNGNANVAVVAIGDAAFQYCGQMMSVSIPPSVRTICSNAFNSCYGLGSISIPSDVDSIGHNAFAFIPNVDYSGSALGAPWGALNVNAYHEGQYYYSDSQKSHIVCCERDAAEAILPPTVTSIGDHAFYFCTNLTTLAIDSTVCHIGISAFSRCTGLESVSYNPQLPAISVKRGTFSGCTSLRQISVGHAVTVIPTKFCHKCTSLQHIVIPDNVTKVETDAFMGCTSLQWAVLGNGITYTATSTFEGCTNLQSVVLPDNLQRLGSFTFRDCKSLQEVIIPSALNYVGGKAFLGCNGVERIVCMKNDVPTTGERAFDSVWDGVEVIVPCGRENAYSQNPEWQRFTNISGRSYYVAATSNNPSWGKAVSTLQPTCDDRTAVIEAVPESGCRFVRWDDNSTESPRQIAWQGNGYLRRRAIFEPVVGIQDVEPMTDVRVYTSCGEIVVEGADGEIVRVFDIIGRKLFDRKINDLFFIVNIPQSHPGIFIVKVGNHQTKKVILH